MTMGSSAFRGAIARRDDERRSVHSTAHSVRSTAHAGTHRRAGAAARRAAGSAALRRRELSWVALMTADDIDTDGVGKERSEVSGARADVAEGNGAPPPRQLVPPPACVSRTPPTALLGLSLV